MTVRHVRAKDGINGSQNASALKLQSPPRKVRLNNWPWQPEAYLMGESPAVPAFSVFKPHQLASGS